MAKKKKNRCLMQRCICCARPGGRICKTCATLRRRNPALFAGGVEENARILRAESAL